MLFIKVHLVSFPCIYLLIVVPQTYSEQWRHPLLTALNLLSPGKKPQGLRSDRTPQARVSTKEADLPISSCSSLFTQPLILWAHFTWL